MIKKFTLKSDFIKNNSKHKYKYQLTILNINKIKFNT